MEKSELVNSIRKERQGRYFSQEIPAITGSGTGASGSSTLGIADNMDVDSESSSIPITQPAEDDASPITPPPAVKVEDPEPVPPDTTGTASKGDESCAVEENPPKKSRGEDLDRQDDVDDVRSPSIANLGSLGNQAADRLFELDKSGSEVPQSGQPVTPATSLLSSLSIQEQVFRTEEAITKQLELRILMIKDEGTPR